MRSSWASSVPPARRASSAPSRACPRSSWTRSARAEAAAAKNATRTIRNLGANSLPEYSALLGSGHGQGLRGSWIQPRRTGDHAACRGWTPAGPVRDRGARSLGLPRHRARGLRRPATIPQRRRRARDRPRSARAADRTARPRAGVRARPELLPAPGAADARPRPPALRGPDDRGIRPGGPAPAPPRAEVRPRAARGARSGARGPRAGPGSDPAGRARLIGMSHLDELDEFEAELELQLKREYTAVFGLFRYCVLTQDATYLCNKLDLAQVSQPNYPFFHLRMEDVWVWDKNRPTRIIPRAEVWTSSDVTVEELRGEGEEPSLTAEALAEKIGESVSSDEDS